ncbi:hypothetical protein RE474_04595 [Methanolobus sediminis]|uniref:Uncharacterized protein n=1 Tax=Methanolobus sediminis TaxID=3072978 RepID=A0AA51ULY1_9EURY|nr:hypothetical protein [Methanolobus sediminis]WMW26004.1 hypothetical protein RE474_04595 [Methanolobus sediminis]
MTPSSNTLTYNLEKGEINWDPSQMQISEINQNEDGVSIRLKIMAPTSNYTTENKKTSNLNDLPSVEEVTNYILTKPDYKHDSIELQTHFLGRIIKSRGAHQKLYQTFAGITRNARDAIEKKYQGTWITPNKRRVEGQRPVTIYEFSTTQIDS